MRFIAMLVVLSGTSLTNGASVGIALNSVNTGGTAVLSGGSWSTTSAASLSSYPIFVSPAATQTGFTLQIRDATLASDTAAIFFSTSSSLSSMAWALDVADSTLAVGGAISSGGVDRAAIVFGSGNCITNTNVTLDHCNISVVTWNATAVMSPLYKCAAFVFGQNNGAVPTSIKGTIFSISNSFVTVACGLQSALSSAFSHFTNSSAISGGSNAAHVASELSISNTVVTVMGTDAIGVRLSSLLRGLSTLRLSTSTLSVAGSLAAVGLDLTDVVESELVIQDSKVLSRVDVPVLDSASLHAAYANVAVRISTLTSASVVVSNSTLLTDVSSPLSAAALGAVTPTPSALMITSAATSSAVTIANGTMIGLVRFPIGNTRPDGPVGAVFMASLVNTSLNVVASSITAECILNTSGTVLAALYLGELSSGSRVALSRTAVTLSAWNGLALGAITVGGSMSQSALAVSNGSTLTLFAPTAYATSFMMVASGGLLTRSSSLTSSVIQVLDSSVVCLGGLGSLTGSGAVGIGLLATVNGTTVDVIRSSITLSDFLTPATAFVSLSGSGSGMPILNTAVNVSESRLVGSGASVIAVLSNVDPIASVGNRFTMMRNKAAVSNPMALTWVNISTTQSPQSTFADVLLQCNTVNSQRVPSTMRVSANIAGLPVTNLDCATRTRTASAPRSQSESESNPRNTTSLSQSGSAATNSPSRSNSARPTRSVSLTQSVSRSLSRPPKNKTRTRTGSSPPSASRTPSPSPTMNLTTSPSLTHSQQTSIVTESLSQSVGTHSFTWNRTGSRSHRTVTSSGTNRFTGSLTEAGTATERATPTLTAIQVAVVTIPDVVTAGKVTVAITSTVSSLVSTPGAALQASRASIAIDLAYCDPNLGQELDYMNSPTQLSLGDGAERYYLGAAVGNILLVMGVFGLGIAFAIARYFIVLHRYALTSRGVVLIRGQGRGAFVYSPYNNDGRNGNVSPTFGGCLGWARCPSFWLFAPMFLLQSTVTAVVSLIRFGTSAQTIGLGLLLFIIIGFGGALLTWLIITATRSRCVYVDKERINAKEDKETQPVYRKMWRFLRHEYGAWIDTPGATGYCRQYGALFDEYVGTAGYFNVVEIGFSVALGVFAQLATGDSCFPMAVTIVFSYGVYLAFVVIKRPHAMRMNFYFILITTSIQFVSAMVVSAVVYKGPASATDSVNTFVQMLSSFGMFLSVLKTSFDLGYALYRLVFRNYTMAEITNEAEETGLIRGKERLRNAAVLLLSEDPLLNNASIDDGGEPLQPALPAATKEPETAVQQAASTITLRDDEDEEMAPVSPSHGTTSATAGGASHTRRVQQFSVLDSQNEATLSEAEMHALVDDDDGIDGKSDSLEKGAVDPLGIHLTDRFALVIPDDNHQPNDLSGDGAREGRAAIAAVLEGDLLDSLLSNGDNASSVQPKPRQQPNEETAAAIFGQLQNVLTRRTRVQNDDKEEATAQDDNERDAWFDGRAHSIHDDDDDVFAVGGGSGNSRQTSKSRRLPTNSDSVAKRIGKPGGSDGFDLL